MGVKKKAKGGESAAEPIWIAAVLRPVAGGYLVYLASGLLQEYLKPVGGDKMVQLGCGVLFGVTGAFPADWPLKESIKGEYIKYGEIPDDEKDDRAEDT